MQNFVIFYTAQTPQFPGRKCCLIYYHPDLLLNWLIIPEPLNVTLYIYSLQLVFQQHRLIHYSFIFGVHQPRIGLPCPTSIITPSEPSLHLTCRYSSVIFWCILATHRPSVSHLNITPSEPSLHLTCRYSSVIHLLTPLFFGICCKLTPLKWDLSYFNLCKYSSSTIRNL